MSGRRRPCRRAAATTGRAARRQLAQLADDELALDLEADDEEEDRHQPVVDPEMDRRLETRSRPAPKARVGRLPRRHHKLSSRASWPNERGQRCRQEQEDAARCFNEEGRGSTGESSRLCRGPRRRPGPWRWWMVGPRCAVGASGQGVAFQSAGGPTNREPAAKLAAPLRTRKMASRRCQVKPSTD